MAAKWFNSSDTNSRFAIQFHIPSKIVFCRKTTWMISEIKCKITNMPAVIRGWIKQSNKNLIKNYMDPFCKYLACLNTKYPTDSYFVYVLKMEYGWNFWLKVSFSIIVNPTKIFFLKSLHAQRRSFLLLKLYFWTKTLTFKK